MTFKKGGNQIIRHKQMEPYNVIQRVAIAKMSNSELIAEIQRKESEWKSNTAHYFRAHNNDGKFTTYNAAGRMLATDAVSNEGLESVRTHRQFVFENAGTTYMRRTLASRLGLRLFKGGMPARTSDFINVLINKF